MGRRRRQSVPPRGIARVPFTRLRPQLSFGLLRERRESRETKYRSKSTFAAACLRRKVTLRHWRGKEGRRECERGWGRGRAEWRRPWEHEGNGKLRGLQRTELFYPHVVIYEPRRMNAGEVPSVFSREYGEHEWRPAIRVFIYDIVYLWYRDIVSMRMDKRGALRFLKALPLDAVGYE